MTSRILHSRSTGVPGSFPDIVILHGVFGHSRNWMSIASALAVNRRIFSVDLRNHGQSFHDESFSLEDLSGDLQAFVDFHKIRKPVILGHSLGGLTACAATLNGLVEPSALIIVDIAPRSYTIAHSEEMSLLLSDISGMRDRNELEAFASQFVDDPSVRAFLLTNAIRKESGGYFWQLNIAAISASESRTSFPRVSGSCDIPALFIRGHKSDFIGENDIGLIHTLFTDAAIAELPTGHWPHAEDRTGFLKQVTDFLESRRLG